MLSSKNKTLENKLQTRLPTKHILGREVRSKTKITLSPHSLLSIGTCVCTQGSEVWDKIVIILFVLQRLRKTTVLVFSPILFDIKPEILWKS